MNIFLRFGLSCCGRSNVRAKVVVECGTELRHWSLVNCNLRATLTARAFYGTCMCCSLVDKVKRANFQQTDLSLQTSLVVDCFIILHFYSSIVEADQWFLNVNIGQRR